MKSKRRNQSAQFKVTLATAKCKKTIAELSQEYKVHPTQIVQWKTPHGFVARNIFCPMKERTARVGVAY